MTFDRRHRRDRARVTRRRPRHPAGGTRAPSGPAGSPCRASRGGDRPWWECVSPRCINGPTR